MILTSRTRSSSLAIVVYPSGGRSRSGLERAKEGWAEEGREETRLSSAQLPNGVEPVLDEFLRSSSMVVAEQV